MKIYRSYNEVELEMVTRLGQTWMSSHRGLKGVLFDKIKKLMQVAMWEAYQRGFQDCKKVTTE